MTATRQMLGWAGTIDTRPGQTAAKLQDRIDDIAWAYDVHPSSVILTPGRTARQVHIEVYRVNPLQTARTFIGPSLDAGAGRCVVGHDTMGRPVHWRFWRPEWGACHGLVFGTSGAGKSAFVQRLMTEVRHSGQGVVWFFDPEEGLSAPPWIDAANHYAGADEDGGLDPITRGLAQLGCVWAYRRHQLAEARQTWKGPTEQFPLIFVVVDESPDVLADPRHAEILKRLLRKGRKVGISVVLIAQVPSLSELGDDQTIRSMAASVNVVAFRTSDKMSAAMGMPKTLPIDPVTLPEEWPDGTSTAGLAYMAGGQMVRTEWLPDDDAWTWAQAGEPADLDEGSARAAGGDYLRAWLIRHGRDDEAAQVADADRPAASDDSSNVVALAGDGTVRERVLAVLAELHQPGVPYVLTGVIHKHLARDGQADLTQVSRALRKAAQRGECLDLGHGRWGVLDSAAQAAEGE